MGPERQISSATHALLVRMVPRPGRSTDVIDLLHALLRLAADGSPACATRVVGVADGSYGILHLFRGERDRRIHLSGPVRQAVAYRSVDLFAGPPSDELLDVLATSAPDASGVLPNGRGTVRTFAPTGRGTSIGFRCESPSEWLALGDAQRRVTVIRVDTPVAAAGDVAVDADAHAAEVVVTYDGTPVPPATTSDCHVMGLRSAASTVADLTLPELDLSSRRTTSA